MKKILIIIGSIVLAIGVALAIILPIVLNNNNSNPIEPDYRSIKAIQVTEEAYCKRDEKELAIYEGMNFRNNDSNYKFKILVDDVEYELDSNSNNEYYGEVIKVLPKENQDYFYGYYDFDTYEYSFDLEYSINLTSDKGIRCRYIDYFEYNDLNIAILNEEGYLEKVDTQLYAIGNELSYYELAYFSDYYGYIAIPDRILANMTHQIYDTLEDRILDSSELSLALNTPSNGRYNVVYRLTENIYTSIPLKVYNPNGATISLNANQYATYDFDYVTKDGENSLNNISTDKSISGVISFTLYITLNDFSQQVFAGWYKLVDDEFVFISKSTTYELMPEEDLNLYALVISNESGTAGILLKNNTFVTSYQSLYGEVPPDFDFAFKDLNDNIFKVDISVLNKQYNGKYYQICQNNSKYNEITSFNKVYSTGCFIIITFKNGTLALDYEFKFTSALEPDTLAPITFTFNSDTMDANKVKFYDSVGNQALTKELYKDDLLLESANDITLGTYNTFFSMIINVRKSSSCVDGNLVSFSIDSEGYGIHGLSTDNFSPSFYLVRISDNKVEEKIEDLSNIELDTSLYRVVAIADSLYSENLNLNRDAEYRSFYRSDYATTQGAHRIVEFNIYLVD